MVVVVDHWLRDVCIFDSGLQRVEISLRIRHVVKVDDLAFVLGMTDFNTDSAP